MKTIVKAYARRFIIALPRLPGGKHALRVVLRVTPVSDLRRRQLLKTSGVETHEGRFTSRPIRALQSKCTGVMISTSLSALRRGVRSRAYGVSSATTWVMDRLPFDDDQIARLYSAVFSYENQQVSSGRALDHSRCLIRLSDLRTRPIDGGLPGEVDFRRSIDELAKHDTVHVFLETGAAIPEYLADGRLAHTQIAVYSFQNRSTDLETLGIGARAFTVSLRDRFPDISPESEALHIYARILAQRVIDDFVAENRKEYSEEVDNSPWGQQSIAVLAQGLEDDIAWRLALLECYREAMKDIKSHEPAVFVAFSHAFVPNGLNALLSIVAEERFFISPSGNIKPKIFEFWRSVFRTIKLKRSLVDGERVGLPTQFTLSRSSSGRLKTKALSLLKRGRFNLRDQLDLARALSEGRGLAEKFLRTIGTEPVELVLYAPSAPAYVETVSALVSGPVNSSSKAERKKALVSCTVGADPSVLKHLSQDADTVIQSIDFSSFSQLLKSRVTGEFKATLEDRLLKLVDEGDNYPGFETGPFLLPRLVGFVTGGLKAAIAAWEFGRCTASLPQLQCAITCPGRNWLVRATATGYYSSPAAGPVVDIQALNVLDHAKYIAPVADIATVIDSTSVEIYDRALGFPAESIRLTGTPRNDHLRDSVLLLDRSKIAKLANLNPDCSKRILLASQLQPFERMAAIATALANFLATAPDVELIVKMHPREGDARTAGYRNIFERAGVSDQVSIEESLTPAQAIAASDICITIYSNMGREAALVGRHVIIALFDEWEPPIRLDLEGLAVSADNEAQFKKTLGKVLGGNELDNTATEGSEKKVNSYFENNPHLLSGSALKNIRNAIDQAIADKLREVPAIEVLPSNNEELIGSRWSSQTGGFREKLASQMHDAKRIHVVVEDGVPLTAVPIVFPKQAEVTIFIPKPGAIQSSLSGHCTIETGRYSTANRTAIEEAAVRADDMARALTKSLIRQFSKLTSLEDISHLEDAIWLRVRPIIIEAERATTVINGGLKNSSDVLLVIGSTNAFFEETSQESEKHGHSRRFFLHQEKNGFQHLFDGDQLPGTGIKTPEKLVPEKRKKMAIELFEKWLSALPNEDIKLPDGPVLLLSCAWHLKTVPPTLLPVIQQLPDELAVVGFNYSEAMVHDARVTLDKAREGRQSTANRTVMFGPEGLASYFPSRPARSAKIFEQIFQLEVSEKFEAEDIGYLTRQAIINAAGTFGRLWLWEMLSWQQFCKGIFRNPDKQSLSVACPGRQWHTEVAHITAARSSIESMTIQNAFMSSGYTYTKPTGSIVTAIDSWSADLFIKEYKVPQNSVQVTSTPRFDYLPQQLASLDPGQSREKLDVPHGTAVMMFAAQEGFDAETYAIATALAEMKRTDRPVHIFIKLHPRSSTELVDGLEQLPAISETLHQVTVTRDHDINTLLAASDIVLTIYSNVGIEAAVLGKSLIIAKFTKMELPLPLDQFNIGYTAGDPADLQKAVLRFLTDDDFKEKMRNNQRRYFEENPLMQSGGSSAKITSLIVENLN